MATLQQLQLHLVSLTTRGLLCCSSYAPPAFCARKAVAGSSAVVLWCTQERHMIRFSKRKVCEGRGRRWWGPCSTRGGDGSTTGPSMSLGMVFPWTRTIFSKRWTRDGPSCLLVCTSPPIPVDQKAPPEFCADKASERRASCGAGGVGRNKPAPRPALAGSPVQELASGHHWFPRASKVHVHWGCLINV